MSRRTQVLVLVLAALVALVRCGGGGDSFIEQNDLAVEVLDTGGDAQEAGPDGAIKETAEATPDTATENTVECWSDDDCDDGDECTADTCDAGGGCLHAPKEGWCHIGGECWEAGEVNPEHVCQACLPAAKADDWSNDDTLECGEADACQAPTCRAGQCVMLPVQAGGCDDHNPCTDDSCDPATGCVHNNNAASCDDGDVCTPGDTCDHGVCQPGVGELDCDDHNPCTDDGCNQTLGCFHGPNALGCDDGDPCTLVDACQGGQCLGSGIKDCEDGNPCTDDWCKAGHGCVSADNTAECTDGDPCTVGDRCVGTVCVPGAAPLPCDDQNPCTDDACVPQVGCQWTPNQATCDDHNLCTEVDTCQDSKCVGVSTEPCDDGNPCTEDYCYPESGCGTNPLTGTACQDDKACTVYEQCDEGVCVGQPLPCDDGNDCTDDVCLEPDGCDAVISGQPGCRLQVVVDWPPRGVTLDQGALVADSVVVVTGHVDSPADPGPLLTLNGVPVVLNMVPPADPPAEGELNPGLPKVFTFAVPLTPEQGMNLLKLEASNRFGQTDKGVQSFYYSTVYHPVSADDFEAGKVAQGAAIGLSQEFLDDNDPEINDLAAIVNLVFASLDLTSAISNPASHVSELGCDYDLNLNSVTFGETDTDLRILSNGLGLQVAIANFHINFRLQQTSGGFWCPGSTNGEASANPAVITTTVAMSVQNGEVVAQAQGTSVNLQNFSISVSSWFLNLILGLLQGAAQSMIQDAAVDAINDQINPMIGSVFGALALNQDISIPSLIPGGNPVTVYLRSKPSSLSFVPDTSMLVGEDTAVMGAHTNPYSTLGAIGFANCLQSAFTGNLIDFGVFSRINVGLFDDLVNQILHAAYEGGLFEAVLGPDVIPADQLAGFGITDADIALSFMLPPIITACDVGTPPEGALNPVGLEIGDIMIDAQMKMGGLDTRVIVYASLHGNAGFGVTEKDGVKQIGLNVYGFDRVETEVAEVIGGPQGASELFGTLIETALVPVLLSQLSFGDAIGFELPSIDLSGAVEGLPPGTALEIVPDQVFRTSNANTVLKGTVSQSTP
jgi:hypothetical protein